MAHEKIVLVLGETTKLSAKDGIKADDNRLSKDFVGKWGSSGSCAVITSEDLTKDVVEVTGASVGKCLVYYRQDTRLTPEETIASSIGGGAPDQKRQIDDAHAIAFEVEVVPKKEDAAKNIAGPLSSSSKFDGRLPMNESQTEPSEKTPYGMDQENKPVAPFPGMVNPNDDSTVARQSEDAQSKGTQPAAVAEAEKAEKPKTASKRGASKAKAKTK